MNVNVDNFEKYSNDIYDLVITPANMDVGGGKITKEEIDQINEYPNAKSLIISGLNQETFEYLIVNFGAQFEAISFYKNKLVTDLSLLGTLRQLKYVHYFFNQRVTRLWDMSKNDNLLGLALYDFSKLHSIDEIVTAQNLKRFAIGNKVWAKSNIDSLKPLVNSTITSFSFWGDKVLDNDFMCLTKSQIRELDLNVCKFKVEELAELVAGFGEISGSVTKPYVESSWVDVDGTKTTYYFPCKGKKRFVKGNDDAKLSIYIAEFEKLVEKCRRCLR